ncbi:MAG: DoxX family membrane protein [Thermoplasmata archaeon]
MVIKKIESFFERKTEKVKKYYPVVLRVGIASVFLWFGFSQIKNPSQWTGMMPEYAKTLIPIGANNLIYLNGVIEVILAVLLLLGLFTRTVSLLLTLHLLHIITIVGYGAVAARDLALAIATFAIFLHGADEFCLDKIKSNKKENEINSINDKK